METEEEEEEEEEDEEESVIDSEDEEADEAVTEEDSASGSEEGLDWRKVCRKVLRELRRSGRSLFFREPVNVELSPVSFYRRLGNPSIAWHLGKWVGRD